MFTKYSNKKRTYKCGKDRASCYGFIRILQWPRFVWQPGPYEGYKRPALPDQCHSPYVYSLRHMYYLVSHNISRISKQCQ